MGDVGRRGAKKGGGRAEWIGEKERERDGARERERDVHVHVPAHTKDPCHCNELGKPNEQQRNCRSKLVEQLKEIDTIAKDKGKRHQEEEEADNG